MDSRTRCCVDLWVDFSLSLPDVVESCVRYKISADWKLYGFSVSILISTGVSCHSNTLNRLIP